MDTSGISLRRLKTFLTNLENKFAEKKHSHTTLDITGLDTALSNKALKDHSHTTVNGHTIESDVPSGAKFTDTNTWRGIQDNLTSTSTTDSLSANQGKVLKGLIDEKTSNTGTITGIKMNGALKGTSSVIDLGTVLTGGKQTTTSTADGGSNIYTFSDNSTITVKNGSKGSGGSNGTSAAWFTGTAVTGTATSATAFTVSGSKAGDMYLNTSTYNVYRASAANSWVYVCNIKGANGTNGVNATTTAVATTSANGLMSKDMVTKLNGITSGANAVIQVLNTSQYNALSEAQKKNGTIYLVN